MSTYWEDALILAFEAAGLPLPTEAHISQMAASLSASAEHEQESACPVVSAKDENERRLKCKLDSTAAEQYAREDRMLRSVARAIGCDSMDIYLDSEGKLRWWNP